MSAAQSHRPVCRSVCTTDVTSNKFHNSILQVATQCFCSTLSSMTVSIRFGDYSFVSAKVFRCGPGWLSLYSDSLRAGRSRGRIPVRARFSAPVQTGPGTHSASYTMGTGSFPGVKRPGRGVHRPPHLAPRLKKEYSCTPTPPLGLRGLL